MLKHVAVALFCCLSLISINASAVVAPEHEGEPFFDIRTTEEKDASLDRLRAASPGAASRWAAAHQAFAEAEASLRRTTPGLRIQLGAESGGPEIIGVEHGARVLTGASSQSREAIARGFVEQNAGLYALSPGQATQLQLDADYVNPAGNLAWVRLAQYVNKRPVFGSEVTVALTADGEIARVVGQLAGAVEPAEAVQQANVGAAQAVMLAASSVGIAMLPGDVRQLSVAADGRSARFASSLLSDEVEVKQVYFPLGQGALELAWSMVVWEPVDAYYTLIAASDGRVLWRKNITEHEAHSYEVYDGASPAPFQPGPTDPTLGQQAPRVASVSLRIDSQNALGDPWLAVGQATTDGNNVEAGLDIAAPDGVDAPLAESALNVFLYSSNPPPGIPAPGEDPTTAASRDAAVTNLFYWSNRFHDLTYDLGFTEPARNFQDDNYGRGGLGGDRIRSEAQDSSGTNNANFSTPADGGRGRNQMYLWTGPDPDRDGSLDADIVIHELTHGLSNRLHNNASGLSTNMARGMGEGWSDFYAHALLAKPTDPINGIYTIGGYSTLAVSGGNNNNYYYGIRRFPNAVIGFTGGPNNRPHNPLTFADIDSTQFDISDGAYPRGPFGSATVDQVHNLGEVWSAALWEARAQIIGSMGAEAGNQRMLQLVTDGMKLSPSAPDFLQARDAIIAADCAAYGGSNEINLWTGFALRGMGFGAQVLNVGNGIENTRVVESFTGPLDGNLPVLVGTTGWQPLSCPQDDRNPAPGDVVQLVVPITNPLCGTALTNVVVSAPGGGSQTYPTLAGGASQTALLDYTIPLDAVCSTTLQVPVTITHDGGTQSIMVDVPIGEAPIGTTAFTNNTLVNLPNGQPGMTSGVASLYPSSISVSGITQPVLGVRVTLNGYSHTFPDDMDLLLVGPTGQKMVILSDAFGTVGATNATVDLSDDAAAIAPDAGTVPTGMSSYRPANYGATDSFAAPAPDGPYLDAAPAGAATFASAFGGLDANGTWSLYISDDSGGDVGTLTGGWTLNIMTSQPVVCEPCAIGVNVTESDGTTAVSEGGATDSYEVVLGTAPSSDVSVNLAFDAAQLTVNGDTDGSTTLVFNSANWATPQVVNVVASNDRVVEAPLANSVIVQSVSSADPAYAAIDPADVSVAVTDNDSAVVAFAPNDDAVVESAGSFQKVVVLTISADGVGPVSMQNALSVPLTFIDASALEPEDFTLTTSQVTFPAGATSDASQNAVATIVNDAIDEDAESFAINLVTAGVPSNISFGRSTTNVQINDDDSAGVTLVQSGGSTAVTEGAASDSYTLVLTSQPTAPVTIALSGAQVAPSGDLVFTAGNWDQPQTVTVIAIDDTVVEGTHVGSVTHGVTSSDAKYQGLVLPPLAVEVTDNDTATVVFDAAGSAFAEGSSAAPIARLDVISNGAPGGSVADAVVVDLVPTHGTTEAADLTLTTAQLIFPAGSAHAATAAFSVFAVDDRAVEANETFDLGLSVASGLATVGAATSFSITDNDSATVGFALPTSNAPEGITPYSVEALLAITGVGTGPLVLEDAASVTITDTPGTATTPADYTRTTASISFAAGSSDGATQPILASIVDDALYEDDESFTLGFGAITAAAAGLSAGGTHTVTIVNDDPLPTLSITSPSQPEGDVGTTPMNFEVSLSAVSGRDVTFTRATQDDTATVGDNDYMPLSAAQVTIPAGEQSITLAVLINGDTIFEGDESFSLNITDVVDATPDSLSATGTIEEDAQQPTTTTITSNLPDPSVVGQSYTVNVSVSAQTLSPLGTVTVSDGTDSCGPITLSPNAAPDSSGSCELTSSSAGAKVLTASYTPANEAFAQSSGTGNHQVDPASTTISVSGPVDSRINQPVSFSFILETVAPGGGTTSGTVTLSTAGNSCQVTVPTATPACNLQLATLGPATVSASYAPDDGDHLASTSSGAGDAQTLVFALADLQVIKTAVLGAFLGQDLLVYTITLRNLGSDTAVNLLLTDEVPEGLSDVLWTCDSSGGVSCPQNNGSGDLVVAIASFPVGGLLNYSFYGYIDGNLAEIENTATVSLSADGRVQDPDLDNNSATVISTLDQIFTNGFESPLVNSPNGSYVLASKDLRSLLDDVARILFVLDDDFGQAARIYARVHADQVQYALAQRDDHGRLRLGAWQTSSGDPELSWTASETDFGWIVDEVQLREHRPEAR